MSDNHSSNRVTDWDPAVTRRVRWTIAIGAGCQKSIFGNLDKWLEALKILTAVFLEIFEIDQYLGYGSLLAVNQGKKIESSVITLGKRYIKLVLKYQLRVSIQFAIWYEIIHRTINLIEDLSNVSMSCLWAINLGLFALLCS